MKIYYDPQTGRIFYAVWESDLPKFTHSTNIPLSILDIDEIPENQVFCIDLPKKLEKKNDNGERKYYIENGELYQRDNWVERSEDV